MIDTLISPGNVYISKVPESDTIITLKEGEISFINGQFVLHPNIREIHGASYYARGTFLNGEECEMKGQGTIEDFFWRIAFPLYQSAIRQFGDSYPVEQLFPNRLFPFHSSKPHYSFINNPMRMGDIPLSDVEYMRFNRKKEEDVMESVLFKHGGIDAVIKYRKNKT